MYYKHFKINLLSIRGLSKSIYLSCKFIADSRTHQVESRDFVIKPVLQANKPDSKIDWSQNGYPSVGIGRSST